MGKIATRILTRGGVAALLLVVPTILICVSAQRLNASLPFAREEIELNAVAEGHPLGTAAYENAYAALGSNSSVDADELTSRAELAALTSTAHPDRIKVAKALATLAISRGPANPRAWTLLCEIEAQINAIEAANCMNRALFVAPFDWFTAGRRAVLGAYLWPYLETDSQDAVARRLRSLWVEPRMRGILWDVYQTKNGPIALEAAFKYDREELRAFNRWLIRRQMCGGTCDAA